jgi:hypothetical protein
MNLEAGSAFGNDGSEREGILNAKVAKMAKIREVV